MTISRADQPAETRLEIAFRDCFASLAAVDFLRYANTAKTTRFGALDDLRRH